MTAVFIDPVIGAAVTNLGLTILPGLPCPTCGGTGWRCRNSNLMCTHRVHQGCPACNGSGVWTPPDSPVTIGVTSTRPEGGELDDSGREWRVVNHRGCWLVSDWTGATKPIVLSSMIGEGTLRPLKVIDDQRTDLPTFECVIIGSGMLVTNAPKRGGWRDIFLPGLKPDDTVYLLDGFTESVDTCDCIGLSSIWGKALHGCSECHGTGERVSCPFSVDAPDHPCVVTS